MKTVSALMLLFCMVVGGACAKAHSGSSPSVQQVTSPVPGYTCFAIIDGNGNAVGGNCSKD